MMRPGGRKGAHGEEWVGAVGAREREGHGGLVEERPRGRRWMKDSLLTAVGGRGQGRRRISCPVTLLYCSNVLMVQAFSNLAIYSSSTYSRKK
jgi:hypothetical protein